MRNASMFQPPASRSLSPTASIGTAALHAHGRRGHGADRAGRRIRPGAARSRSRWRSATSTRPAASPAASSSPTRATRRARAPSPSTRRRSSSRSRRCRSIIGGIISSVSIPILTSVTAPAGVVQVSPASSSPTLTAARRRGQDQRRLLPHHHLGRAAGHRGGEIRARPGPEEARDHPRQQRLRRQHGGGVPARPTRRSAAQIASDTPYNENQASYAPEVTRGDGRRSAGALPRQLSRSTARPSRAPGSRRAAPRSSC